MQKKKITVKSETEKLDWDNIGQRIKGLSLSIFGVLSIVETNLPLYLT